MAFLKQKAVIQGPFPSRAVLVVQTKQQLKSFRLKITLVVLADTVIGGVIEIEHRPFLGRAWLSSSIPLPCWLCASLDITWFDFVLCQHSLVPAELEMGWCSDLLEDEHDLSMEENYSALFSRTWDSDPFLPPKRDVKLSYIVGTYKAKIRSWRNMMLFSLTFLLVWMKKLKFSCHEETLGVFREEAKRT